MIVPAQCALICMKHTTRCVRHIILSFSHGHINMRYNTYISNDIYMSRDGHMSHDVIIKLNKK
jgi:hypothetical protein